MTWKLKCFNWIELESFSFRTSNYSQKNHNALNAHATETLMVSLNRFRCGKTVRKNVQKAASNLLFRTDPTMPFLPPQRHVETGDLNITEITTKKVILLVIYLYLSGTESMGAWRLSFRRTLAATVQNIHSSTLEWNIRSGRKSAKNKQVTGGFPTYDHIHALSLPLRKSEKYRIPVCLALVSYTEVFISVKSTAVINALHEVDVHLTYVHIINVINKRCTTDVRLLDDVCHVKINRGVRQCDGVSSKLLAVTLDGVFSKTNRHSGITAEGKMLPRLRFADDCVFNATT